MSADDKKSRGGQDAGDHALWSAYTRGVTPHKRRPPQASPAKPADPERKSAAPPKPAAAPRPAPTPKPPPLMALDRRTRQRLARGAETIEARIDLHGMTQNEAHAALLRFLRRAQERGTKFALVITGKGGRAGDFSGERGVLRRQVPLWLALPEFRPYVLGVEEAHIGHGGEGALYVRLRRARGD